MKPKFIAHLALAMCLTVSFLVTYQTSSAQNDTCCVLPDSLRVTLVTDSIFCVAWHVPTVPGCHNPFKANVQWKPVDSTGWQSQQIIYSAGTHDTFYCTTGIPGVKYQWRVKHVCKDSAGDNISTAWVKGPNFTMHTSFARNSFSADGAAYSPGKDLKNTGNLMTRLYPNPSGSIVNIEGFSRTGGSLKITVVNMTGQQVYEQSFSTAPGNYKHSINISALRSGTYFIKVSNGSASGVSKLIKQ